MPAKAALIAWARKLKRNVLAVWIAAKDSRTPLTPKIIAIVVAGYALSPIDLIPDFIPVVGYLDDLIIVPLGIALVIRLMPDNLMAEFSQQAEKLVSRPVSYIAAIMVVLVWGLILVVLFMLFS